MPIQITYEGAEDGVLETQIALSFDKLDKQFSTYSKTSDVILFSKHKLPVNRQDLLFKKVFLDCTHWNQKTSGAFDAFYGKQYDPSGYVKGLAIEHAARMMSENGINHYIINASGDVVTASSSDHSWNIGLQHPLNKRASIGAIRTRNLAIATSGTYERGYHITNPKTGEPAQKLLSVTIIGKDIVTADVLATAAFASEDHWRVLVDSFDDYEALVIGADGTVEMTPGFAHLAS